MKTFLLAMEIFKKNKLLNSILILELACISVILVVVINMSLYNTYIINTFKNSSDRIIYCMNPNRGEDDLGIDNLVNTLQQKTKGFEWFKGISNIRRSYMFLNKDTILNQTPSKENELVNIFLMDDESTEVIRYPLSKGNWFDTEKLNEYAPCVIGGYLSNKYKIGDKITGYIPIDEKNVKEVKYIITGVLSKPEQILSLNLVAINTELPLSDIYKNESQTSLFLITSLLNSNIPSIPYSNVFLYLDKSCPENKINELRKEISLAYTRTDTELINDEQKELSHLMTILLPFIIMLFLVSSSGIISMCMLTTLKNMDKFKIYYITGCSQKRAILITGIYSLIYFLISGLIFIGILYFYSSRRIGRIESSLFILNGKSLFIVSISSIIMCIFSFIIPFFSLKRNKPIDMLKMN